MSLLFLYSVNTHSSSYFDTDIWILIES